MTGHAAFRELIKCRTPYSSETARTAKHNLLLRNVLRSQDQRRLVPFGKVLSGDEPKWRREWAKCIVLLEAERFQALEDGSVPEPYWDPGLKRGGFIYNDFIHRLRRAGPVGFHRRVKSTVGFDFCFARRMVRSE